MTVKRVAPSEAFRLMTEEGYVYIDVRSEPEFAGGHPEGAYNVPIAQPGPMGMRPNPEFLAVVRAVFGRDARLVVGCKTGVRSHRAAEMLLLDGYEHVIDQRAGFSGAVDPFGRLVEPGWKQAGLPVSQVAVEGRSYPALAAKKHG